MGIIISSNDFSYGKYTINKSDSTRQDLKEYIENNEQMFIYQLLGIKLGDLFIADIDPSTKQPITQRFIDIYNPLYFKYKNQIRQSKGILEVIKGLIFMEFTREQNFKNNINGNSQNIFESGEMVGAYRNGVTLKYNQAIDSYTSIQAYCYQENETYPEWDGEVKTFMSPF